MRDASSFRNILRATATLGSSSIVGILVGLVSAKAWALLLGPSGLGYMGLLQNLVGLAGLVAGMGIGTGLVRSGAAALAKEDVLAVVALRRAAWLLFALFGSLALAILALFRSQFSLLVIGEAGHDADIVLMAVALLFTLAAGIQTATLNAHHRIGALARNALVNSILGTVLSLGCVWLWGAAGIAPAIIATAALSFLSPTVLLRRHVHTTNLAPSREDVLRAAIGLVRFGAPYTASMFVGAGVQLSLPILVQHQLGLESVGYYRVAIVISVTYLGFLPLAMGQDYYPRLSAVKDQPRTMVTLVNQQHRLLLMLSVPMILATLALAPYMVSLVYSPQFVPAVDVLEWQLIGDILKFASWTMAYVVLVRCGSIIYFGTELIGGATTLSVSWVAMQALGLAGLGIGFLVSYVVYYGAVTFVARREIQLVWTKENMLLLIGALTAAAIVRLLPFVGLEPLRLPVALLFAAVAGVGAAYIVLREMGGLKLAKIKP